MNNQEVSKVSTNNLSDT